MSVYEKLKENGEIFRKSDRELSRELGLSQRRWRSERERLVSQGVLKYETVLGSPRRGTVYRLVNQKAGAEQKPRRREPQRSAAPLKELPTRDPNWIPPECRHDKPKPWDKYNPKYLFKDKEGGKANGEGDESQRGRGG